MTAFRIVACVLAGGVAGPGAAADLYRCVSDGGAVSYQDAPCGDGSRLSRTIPVLVDPAGAEPAARTTSKRKPPASKPGSAATGSKGSNARGKQRAACEQARKKRDAALERMGLNRTFDKLRALDDEVQAACKGL